MVTAVDSVVVHLRCTVCLSRIHSSEPEKLWAWKAWHVTRCGSSPNVPAEEVRTARSPEADQSSP